MNGIDSVIIARANELSALSSRGANLVTACATLSKVEEKILEETVRINSNSDPNFNILNTNTCIFVATGINRQKISRNESGPSISFSQYS
jgi:hypothetical protein